MQARLKVLHDKANVKQVKLLPVTLIGRSTECNLKIASSQVSRAHCRITLAEDTVYVEDLGSANGTMVNGKMLPPHQPTSVSPGATLIVGPAEFQVDYVASTSQTMVLSRSFQPNENEESSTELIVPVAEEVIPQTPPSEPSAPPKKARPATAPKVARPVANPVVATPVMAPVASPAIGTPLIATAVAAVPIAVAVATAAVPVGTTVDFSLAAPEAAPTAMQFSGFASHDEQAFVSEASPFDFGVTSTNDGEPSVGEPPSPSSSSGKKGGLKSLFSMFGRAAKSSPVPTSSTPTSVTPSVFLPTMEQSGEVSDAPEVGPQVLGFGFEEPIAVDLSAPTLSFERPSASELSTEDKDEGFSQFLNQL